MLPRLAVLAGLLLAATAPQSALAQAQKPTAKPGTPAPQAPAEPAITPSHLALAREVMLSSGISRSFDSIMPAMADQIRKNAVTRPDLAKDLDEVLKSLEPEMALQKNRLIEAASRIYAKRLSEAELKDVVGFFRSPAGKRYVETQPQVLDDMVGTMQDWTQEVSEYIMVRTRAEMGKRGHSLQ